MKIPVSTLRWGECPTHEDRPAGDRVQSALVGRVPPRGGSLATPGEGTRAYRVVDCRPRAPTRRYTLDNGRVLPRAVPICLASPTPKEQLGAALHPTRPLPTLPSRPPSGRSRYSLGRQPVHFLNVFENTKGFA